MNCCDVLFVTLLCRASAGLISAALAGSFFQFGRTMRSLPQGELLSKGRRLLIVLPVINEANLIEIATSRLIQLLDDEPQASAVIVGSVAERDANGRNPTLERANAAAEKNNRIVVLELPTLPASRPRQVNYAVTECVRDPANSWVLQIDIDSEISVFAFRELRAAINAGAEVIQQSALFLGDYNNMSMMQRAHALYQSRWTLSHEWPRFALSVRTQWSLYHVVSHGLCTSAQRMREYGGLPESGTIEDVELGYYMCCRHESVKLLRSLELADTPRRFSDGLAQMYRWALGPMQYPQYFTRFIRKFGVSSKVMRLRGRYFAAMGILGSVAWNLSSYLLLFAILCAASGRLSAIIFLAFYWAEFFISALYFRSYGLLRMRDIFAVQPALLLHLLIRSVPANLAFVNFVTRQTIVTRKANH